MMNWVEREFLLCEWSSFGLSALFLLQQAGLIETTLFMEIFLCKLQHFFNPFSPTCATFLAKFCNPITSQAIELESCSNPPRIQQVL